MRSEASIILLLVLGCIPAHFAFAQDSEHVHIAGYIKDLQTVSFRDDVDSLWLSGLIHNRFNISSQPAERILITLGIRNLLWLGDQVKLTPSFAASLDQDNGYLDLSHVWVNKYSMVLATKIDRLNIEGSLPDGYVRIGRQRVNWGVSLIWNPNDIFNTYNFLDFDYEERPGVDALRMSYTLTEQSAIEMAVAPSKKNSLWIGAIKYSFNAGGYDYQFLAGNYKTDIIGGLGFAGSIADAGWKGELSYFEPKGRGDGKRRAVSFTSEVDYLFQSEWYANLSILYNSEGTDELFSAREFPSILLSPKRLMPNKWNLAIQTKKEFSQLVKGSFSIVYSPGNTLLIVLPYVGYSIEENFDIDLLIQSFFGKSKSGVFNTQGTSINLRVRWDY